MWQRPRLLNSAADLLFAAGAAMLLAAGVLWALRQPLLPIRGVWVSAPLRHVARADLEEAVQQHLRGNFLSVSMDDLRLALEGIPWVRKASVRRVWPERLVVRLEEHQPMAHWGNSGSEWVNSFGEVFAAPLMAGAKPELPRLSGPEGSSRTLLEQYGAAVAAFAPLRAKPVRLTLFSRHALEMALDTGLVLKLGREQPSASIRHRLARFIAVYPGVMAGRKPPPAIADLRYPNGFTLYPKSNPAALPATQRE
jgi:cell division protein FtsQ